MHKRAQADYDADPPKGTKHGLDSAEQARWVGEIADGLPGYDVT